MGGGLTQSCIRCFLVASNSLNYTRPTWAEAVHSRKDALCSVSAVVFLRSFSAQRSSWGIAEWALSQREHQGIFLMLASSQPCSGPASRDEDALCVPVVMVTSEKGCFWVPWYCVPCQWQSTYQHLIDGPASVILHRFGRREWLTVLPA